MDFFAALAPDARVLDLGTGNGVLPRWLLQARAHDATQCDAVDAAPIAPTWWQARPAGERSRIRFHGGTPAESLPWHGPTFNAVTSQFGVEYGDLDRIWHEVQRVTLVGAQLRFVMHHPDSLPCTLALEEIGHVDWLLNGGWYAAAKAMLEPISRLSSGAGQRELAQSTRWNGIRHGFDAQQTALQARMSGSACPDLLSEAAHAVAQQVFGSAARLGQAAGHEALNGLKQWLVDTRTRLADMRAHAQSEGQMQAHGALLQERGWQTSSRVAGQSGSVMGWALHANRIG